MTATAYENFDLLVTPIPGGYQARVLYSPAGEAAGDFPAPLTEAELAAFLKPFDVASPAAHSTLAPSPEELGVRLYRAAFSGQVGTCLQRSLDEAARRGVGLRIRLRLDKAAPELADWPWEYLHAPDRPDPFALSTATPIVRYIELDDPVQPLAASLPLRVLAIAANPKTLRPLDIEQEWTRLQKALGPLSEARADRTGAAATGHRPRASGSSARQARASAALHRPRLL